MKRRKKPRAAGSSRERDPAESSAFHPYLLRFLEWFASCGYSPRTLQIRADGVRRFVRWADERGVRTPQDVTRPILERYRRHLYHYRKNNGIRRAELIQLTLHDVDLKNSTLVIREGKA